MINDHERFAGVAGMNALNFMNYLLRFAMLGFLVLVISVSDRTLFPTVRMMAAILCGLVLVIGVGLLLRPRWPDPISGSVIEVALVTRIMMFAGGLIGVWTYFSA
jgi:hypothetical protein